MEQPDPLRPSLPDSIKTTKTDTSRRATDQLKIDTVVVKKPVVHILRYPFPADGTITAGIAGVVSLRSTLANVYESLVVPGRQNNDSRFTVGLTYERK